MAGPPGRSTLQPDWGLAHTNVYYSLFMLSKIRPLVLLLAAASLTPGHAPAAQPAETNAAPASQAPTPSTNTIVAKGKGVEIWRSELDREVTHALAQKAADGRRVTVDQMPSVERQVLQQLIDVRLLAARATDAEKVAAKGAAEKRYAAAKAKLGSENAFNLQLKFLATTREELLAKWTEALAGQAVLKRELKINITDQEARKFYDENPTQFDEPERVRASHILITTRDSQTGAPITEDRKAAKRKAAEAVLKRARAGEDFATLAMAFSNDAGSRAKGGEYTFARGQLVPEVEAVAFSMKTNQISDIVTSADGYHIVKLSEKIPAHKVKFADAAPDIKNGLTKQEIDRLSPEYIAGLRKEAGVEILDEKLKPEESGQVPIVAPEASTEQPGKKPAAK
jgi:peptidyl-prolyl cis-trans isomerase C